MLPKDLVKESLASLAGKKIFLTGGTGFFGKSLLDFISAQSILPDFQITILSRNPQNFTEKFPQYKNKQIKFQKGDIEDFIFPEEKFDYIFHFATAADAKLNKENPLKMADTIVNGSRRVLDFAVKCGAEKVLFSSSGAVYGSQPEELTHTPEEYSGSPQPFAVGSAYGEGKRFAELLGCEYSRKYGFKFLIARCFAFVGPHLDRKGAFAIGNFIEDALQDRSITIMGNGSPHRSYLYSDDLVLWLLTILNKGKSCDPYNVGSDAAVSILELAEKVKTTLSAKGEIVVSAPVSQNNKIERYVPKINKAKEQLGLKVWTSLEDSILKTAELIRSKNG